MAKIYIIHGAYGNPSENWIPWLKAELERMGQQVIVPRFPTPEGQSLENWRQVFAQYELTEGTIMVGHSLGPAFILDVLEHNLIKAAVLVAPFVRELGIRQFDAINSSFYREFDWKKIRKNCSRFVVLHADNDPYVPLDRAEEVARALHVKVEIVPGAGHFNAKAGFTSFPLLLERLRQLQE